MPVKVYKPTTPSRRMTSVVDTSDLTRKRPEKSLVRIKKIKSGRNAQGKITVRHQGGGEKRYYRIIDFCQDKLDVESRVEAIEYDPNRNARIALLIDEDGEKRYIIAPTELKVGDKVVSSNEKIEIKPGNRMPLKYIPTGMMIYNIELTPGRGAQVVRSGGSSAVLQSIDEKQAQVKLPSSEIRLIDVKARASIGQVSNPDARTVRIGKAGRKRHMGIRPTVRGKAMNPVDHPHGGGEGGSPIGLKHPKTPWGKPALGVKTRRKNKFSNRFIVKRRKKRKR
ncbi:50S ribosomal protein L2 [Patescibacteria group bacterium]|nr:50S ribosomal protein L2 [Patescibacteria group bacterium]MBU4512675.1 50S ribosomal protein L2 [Patescibacteria group bacterium]MCG2693578.1 50S ribosomal protein L2 [Candidatus Parcubacteria bacterium]